jgi:hypothetical protein
MRSRLELFDDVFLEILLGLALALLIAVAFAPRLVSLCAGVSTQFTEVRHDVTGQPPSDSPQQTAVSAEPERCKPGFAFWFEEGLWDVCALWIFMCFFCLKLIHEPSVMRYHTREFKADHIKDPGVLGNVLLFFTKILLLGALYLFIIFTYIDGSGKVSDAKVAWSFFFLVLTSYFFPNLIRHLQLHRAMFQSTEDNLSGLRDWLSQVVAVWLALDLVNGIALSVVLTLPIWPTASWWAALGLSLCSVLVIVELFSSHPRVITWIRVQPWLEHLQKTPRWVRIALCPAIIVLPVMYVVFRPDHWELSKIQQYGIVHYGILYLLFVNLVDWILNGRFFFGKPP